MILSSNWFYEGYIDFELKQYVLLGYLQKIEKSFKERKLYTSFSEIINHYGQLSAFQRNSLDIEKHFKKELKSINLQEKLLTYESKEITQKDIDELKNIVEYAVKELKLRIDIGRDIYDEVSNRINFFDIGVVTLTKDEGYLVPLFINEYYIYKYELSPLVLNEENYSSLSLKYIDKVDKNMFNTFETIKSRIFREQQKLTVYGTEFYDITYPYTETVLPVIKRKFMNFLRTNI